MSRRFPGICHKARVLTGGTLRQIRAAQRKSEGASTVNSKPPRTTKTKAPKYY
jgi:hypothetical protein